METSERDAVVEPDITDLQIEALVEFAKMRWFGKPWKSDTCKTVQRANCPTGAACICCKNLIKDQERGLMIFDYGSEAHKPWHLQCFMNVLIPEEMPRFDMTELRDADDEEEDNE